MRRIGSQKCGPESPQSGLAPKNWMISRQGSHRSHGSTVGQLDEEAVFYLRSRGIGLEAARSLLTYAFAADLVERARVDALRERLQEFLFAWIPQGEVARSVPSRAARAGVREGSARTRRQTR